MSAGPAPGYWILTATARPSRHTALCTWPIEAAAEGTSSKDWKYERQSVPIWSSRTLWTLSTGSGGADSCSLVRAAR